MLLINHSTMLRTAPNRKENYPALDVTIKEFSAFLDMRSREGNGAQLQYSCLENPMDGRAWWAVVHGVPKSQT